MFVYASGKPSTAACIMCKNMSHKVMSCTVIVHLDAAVMCAHLFADDG